METLKNFFKDFGVVVITNAALVAVLNWYAPPYLNVILTLVFIGALWSLREHYPYVGTAVGLLQRLAAKAKIAPAFMTSAFTAVSGLVVAQILMGHRFSQVYLTIRGLDPESEHTVWVLKTIIELIVFWGILKNSLESEDNRIAYVRRLFVCVAMLLAYYQVPAVQGGIDVGLGRISPILANQQVKANQEAVRSDVLVNSRRGRLLRPTRMVGITGGRLWTNLMPTGMKFVWKKVDPPNNVRRALGGEAPILAIPLDKDGLPLLAKQGWVAAIYVDDLGAPKALGLSWEEEKEKEETGEKYFSSACDEPTIRLAPGEVSKPFWRQAGFRNWGPFIFVLPNGREIEVPATGADLKEVVGLPYRIKGLPGREANVCLKS